MQSFGLKLEISETFYYVIASKYMRTIKTLHARMIMVTCIRYHDQNQAKSA